MSIGGPLDIRTMPDRASTRLARLFWLSVLVAHVLASAAWFWLEPGGFPWGHPRFWVNRVLAFAAAAWCLVGLVALHRGEGARLIALLPAYPAAWASGAITGRLVFPVTLSRLWLAPLCMSLLMAVSLVPFWRGSLGRSLRAAAVVAGAWALCGAGVVLSQSAEPPATHPLGQTLAGEDDRSRDGRGTVPGVVHLTPRTAICTSEGSITTRLSGLTLEVQPLLRFLSGSPDGCWVVLNRAVDREGPEPRCRGFRESRGDESILDYEFPGLGLATLRVADDPGGEAVAVDASTTIRRPVFSHLNSFCDLEIRGHRRLFLAFSPCPATRIEVLPSDYPVGRPARFAYVDERRRFLVVEASSGEKGPFHTLAEGTLEPSQPLTITLYDEDSPAGRVTLDDWSAQLSTQLSPTAGWGAPENAIEFSLAGSSPSSTATIFFTLAGTSVGRGWDCVGHAAGTYRNRITIGK